MVEMKPGSRWVSAVCEVQVVVTRPPKIAVTLECGGAPMRALGSAGPEGLTPAADRAKGTLLGKRYVDPISGLELLCTKPDTGSLFVDGRAMAVKESKALPSSD